MSLQWNRIGLAFLMALLLVSTAGAQEGVTDVNESDVNEVELAASDVDEQVKLEVDGEQIKAYISWLAQDELQGRKPLTEGYQKAADWAVEHFQQLGLQPAGENGTYLQDVPIERGFTYRVGTPELTVGDRSFLLEDGDFTPYDLCTPATQVEAEVVFVGYGISAPDKGLDEYADVNVAGKIVLALKGSPQQAEVPRLYFGPEIDENAPNEAWEEEAKEQAKIQLAYDQGAVAILLVDEEGEEEPEPRWWGPPRDVPELDTEDADRDFLAFSVKDRVLRAILKPDQQESVRGFERRLNLLRWDIRNKIPHSMATGMSAVVKGFDNVQEYSEELENNITHNVLAKMEGSDPELKNEYIILGGHMDHLGVRNGLVYNGADDNASGTAVVLEVARVLAEADYQPQRTIIFCCWGAEELGLIGSEYYTSHPCDGVTMDQVVTYFNMDMVGLGDGLEAVGAMNFPQIWEVITRDQDEDILKIVEPSTDGPGGSDYAGFISKGIEALGLMSTGGGGHPDYHQPEDDAEKMEAEILRKTGQFVLQGVLNLDRETDVDLIVENRQAIYEGIRLAVTKINPDLEDSDWDCVDLQGMTKDNIRGKIVTVEETPDKGLETGIRGLKSFEGDVEFLLEACDAWGAGRVDIKGSDGWWIDQGKLTEHGRYFLGMMENHDIVCNLVNPSPQLLREVLMATHQPFIVTGFYLLDPLTYDLINKRNVLLSVKFDPAKVDDCVERLEQAKVALGDTDNLVLYVTSMHDFDDAKKDLYLKLIEKGWTAEQIGNDRGLSRWNRDARGISGLNLNVLLPQ